MVISISYNHKAHLRELKSKLRCRLSPEKNKLCSLKTKQKLSNKIPKEHISKRPMYRARQLLCLLVGVASLHRRLSSLSFAFWLRTPFFCLVYLFCLLLFFDLDGREGIGISFDCRWVVWLSWLNDNFLLCLIFFIFSFSCLAFSGVDCL